MEAKYDNERVFIKGRSSLVNALIHCQYLGKNAKALKGEIPSFSTLLHLSCLQTVDYVLTGEFSGTSPTLFVGRSGDNGYLLWF